MHYCLNKKEEKDCTCMSIGNVSLKLLVLSLLVFSISLFGFVTSESVDNSKEGVFFDIKIIDFESPMALGEFFEFTYLVKGMANINEDIKIYFWIEEQGEVITSGSDSIYIGDFEERVETTKIFLPKGVESGVYDFVVEMTYDGRKVTSHRTIEIDIKENIANIVAPEEGAVNAYLISILIGFIIFILFLIFYLERRKIKRQFLQGERWIKRYKVSVLALFLFSIFGFLIYFLDLFSKISQVIAGLRANIFTYLVSPFFYYILFVVLIFIILIVSKMRVEKKGLFKKFKSWLNRQKLKEKLSHVRRPQEKKVEKEVLHTSKSKKASVKLKKVVKKIRIFTNKVFRFLKRSSKSSLKVLSKEAKDFKKKEKRLVKYSERVIKEIYKDTFKRLNKIFGKKSSEKILHEFERAFVRTGKFTQEHLKVLREIISTKAELEKERREKGSKERKLNFDKTIDELRENSRDLIGDLISYSKGCKKSVVRKEKDGAKKARIWFKKSDRFLKKESGLSKAFISKEVGQISKKEKKIAREGGIFARKTKKGLGRTSKKVSRLLRRIFSKRSQKKIASDFRRTFAKTGRFPKKSSATLKNFMHGGTEVRKERLDYSKVNELKEGVGNWIRRIKSGLANLIPRKKKKLDTSAWISKSPDSLNNYNDSADTL